MIIKMQPPELDRRPIISEGIPDEYIGRAIVEVWCEGERTESNVSFAWSVDDPVHPSEEWLRLFLNGLHRAVRHIEDSLQHSVANRPTFDEER